MDNEQNLNQAPEVSAPAAEPAAPAAEAVPMMEQTGGRKNMPLALVILGAVAVAAALLFWLQYSAEEAPITNFTPRPEATPLVDAEVDAQLEQALPTDLDKEFQDIDAEINNI